MGASEGLLMGGDVSSRSVGAEATSHLLPVVPSLREQLPDTRFVGISTNGLLVVIMRGRGKEKRPRAQQRRFWHLALAPCS